MNYIKSLHIEGFKKFTSLDVEFNEHMNILVGENEAGKSVISKLQKQRIRGLLLLQIMTRKVIE